MHHAAADQVSKLPVCYRSLKTPSSAALKLKRVQTRCPPEEILDVLLQLFPQTRLELALMTMSEESSNCSYWKTNPSMLGICPAWHMFRRCRPTRPGCNHRGAVDLEISVLTLPRLRIKLRPSTPAGKQPHVPIVSLTKQASSARISLPIFSCALHHKVASISFSKHKKAFPGVV